MFDMRHHTNPPAPFNPQYKPNAKRALEQASAECWEREGFGELPQPERAAAVVERYNEIMEAAK